MPDFQEFQCMVILNIYETPFYAVVVFWPELFVYWNLNVLWISTEMVCLYFG